MKVTFTCEKCGLVFADHTQTGVPPGWSVRAPEYECPNCAKLRYGPLTEEMVAEALIVCADDWYALKSERSILYGANARNMQKELAAHEARFVLRLLNHLDKSGDIKKIIDIRNSDSFTAETRVWLLDLARQK